MAAIAGLRGSGDFHADARVKDWRETVLFLNPNGTAPLTALLSKAQKAQAADPEFNWYAEPNDIVRLQVNGSHTSAVTTINVDSGDPSATTLDARWGVAKHLVKGDILLVEKATETVAYDNEMIEVVSVISDTQFVVKRGVAGTTAATIGDNVYLLKLGPSYAEGSTSPNASSRNPIKYNNFLQIFKTSYEITTEALAISNLRTGDPLKLERERKVFDHMRDIEEAIMWGRKHETTGDNGKPQRFTAGLRDQIPSSRTTIFSVAATWNTLMDAIQPVYDFESKAGDERVAFIGNAALTAVNKIVAASTGSQLNLGPIVKQYGMNLMQVQMPNGVLYFKRHPLMSRHPVFTKSMFIVDFSQLKWRFGRGLDTHFTDIPPVDGARVKKGEWYTQGGLMVDGGGLTQAYIGNITA